MNIKHAYLFALTGILLTGHVYAENDQANFVNNKLVIPIVDTINIPGMYHDASFIFSEQNGWKLEDFRIGEEVQEIDNLALVKTSNFPTQVFLKISGEFSSSCPEVGKIRIKLSNNKFNIKVYYQHNERIISGDIGCFSAFTPFNKTIQLPIFELPAGEYTYEVNGKFSGSFTLAIDNNL